MKCYLEKRLTVIVSAHHLSQTFPLTPATTKQRYPESEMSKALPTVGGGFSALTFLDGTATSASKTKHEIFVRASKDDEKMLFACNIPWRSSSKDIKTAFEALLALNHPDLGQDAVTKVVLPNSKAVSSPSLLRKEGLHGTSSKGKHAVPPLFKHSKPSTLADQTLESSTAEVYFSSPALLSAVFSCIQSVSWPKSIGLLYHDLYAVARPQLEDIKQHTDAWMLQFDAPSQPSQAKVEEAEKSKSTKRKRREAAIEEGVKSATTRNDVSDGEDDGEWQTVARGGKKGRSKVDLVDTQLAARPGTVKDKEGKLYGKGKASVGVASKKFLKGIASGDGDEERPAKRKKSVGVNFYTESKAKKEASRAKSKLQIVRSQCMSLQCVFVDLLELQSKFEEDKLRISNLQQPRKPL